LRLNQETKCIKPKKSLIDQYLNVINYWITWKDFHVGRPVEFALEDVGRQELGLQDVEGDVASPEGHDLVHDEDYAGNENV